MRRRAYTSRGRFRRYVDRAVEALPDRFRSAADNLLVVVENWPAPEDGDAGGADPDGTLFGVYRGIPLSERASGYNAVSPDVIAVFRRPLLRYCRSRKVLREEIYRTVLHEFGHYLGLDEAAVEHV
jgi:predicted Zn-dependent protease with MMP-like domain